jgi:hypothetical protein
MNKRKLLLEFLPFIIGFIFIKYLDSSYNRVEWYHANIYTYYSRIVRKVTGIFPFSIGDLLYAAFIIFFIIKIIWFIKVLFKKKLNRELILEYSISLIKWVLGIVIIFNLTWGLNYQRAGIGTQLKLKKDLYTEEELINITHLLIEKINQSRVKLPDSLSGFYTYQQSLSIGAKAYQQLSTQFPFLAYPNKSIKKSLFGRFGNYAGFLGYINPFTGEAQVNVTPPKFILPYVSCHEIAHQLGYASESEANFVGYLAARASQDSFFHYSVYFDLFLYANKAIYRKDSVLAKNNFKQLDTLVKIDLKKYKQFNAKYKNPFEPFIRKFYDQYLKANNQIKGVESYDEVIGLLIAFYKKYQFI